MKLTFTAKNEQVMLKMLANKMTEIRRRLNPCPSEILEEGEEYRQPVDLVYTWDDFAADVNKQTDTGVFLIRSGMSESSYMDIPSLKDYGVEVRFSSHDDRHPTDGRIDIESTVLERINGQYGTKGVAQALSELSAKLDKEKPTLDKRAAEIDSAIEDYDAALDENIDRIRLDSDNFLRNWGGDTALKSRAKPKKKPDLDTQFSLERGMNRYLYKGRYYNLASLIRLHYGP